MRINQADPLPGPLGPPASSDHNTQSNASSVLDVQKLLRLLRWRMRLIGGLVAVAVAIAGAALIILPPKYKAVTVVLVDPRQPRVTASEAVLAGIGADAAAVESQVELIQSSALAKRVIEKLGLDKDPEFAAPSLLDSVRTLAGSMLGRATDDETAKLNKLVYRFQTGLSVQRRGMTYILEVGYSSTDAKKAALISGAVADAYLDDQRSRRSGVAADASGWLGGRIDELRARLEKSEQAVADYKASNKMVDVTQGNKLIARQIEDITQQLALARSRSAEALGRIERVKQARPQGENTAALGEVLQSQVVATLRSQYAEVARQEADFRAIYGDRHPSVIAVRAQASDLRRQIDREIARVVEGIRNDYQVAKSRESALEAELATLQKRSEGLSQADVKLRELERDVQSDRALYEQFLSRAKETGQQQSLQIAEARIASPALTPIKPERPAALLLLTAAATLGLLLGIGLVLILEQLRRGFRSTDEVEQALGLPALGLLPEQSIAASKERPTPADRERAAARYVLEFPTSDYAAGLWAIMMRLRRSAPAKAREVLVIASAVPDEGKSTFASNLALASAASGARTLLIDGDSMAMSVSRIFDLKRAGLSEVLDGRAAFSNAVLRDPKSGLFVLGARDPSTATRDVAAADSKAMATLLRELRDQFETIVIDSPAILPVDGGSFVEHADRVVFVVAWESTDRSAIEQALGLLGTYGSKLAGVVLNKAAPRWYQIFDGGRYLRYFAPPVASPPPPARVAVFTRRAAP